MKQGMFGIKVKNTHTINWYGGIYDIDKITIGSTAILPEPIGKIIIKRIEYQLEFDKFHLLSPFRRIVVTEYEQV